MKESDTHCFVLLLLLDFRVETLRRDKLVARQFQIGKQIMFNQ